jgi:hypothetical protein
MWSLARNVTLYNGNVVGFNPFCAYDCDKMLLQQRTSCSARRAFMLANRWSFYANEQPVHDAPSGASSQLRSQLCGQMLNVVTMREPYDHMVSLVSELQVGGQMPGRRGAAAASPAHASCPGAAPPDMGPRPRPAPVGVQLQLKDGPGRLAAQAVHCVPHRPQNAYIDQSVRQKIRGKLYMEWDLEAVEFFAPAVVSSYSLRMLLGRAYLCGDKLRQRMGPRELRQGQALLAQYDAVLALGRDDLNDPVLQAGLGWAGVSLAGVKDRHV